MADRSKENPKIEPKEELKGIKSKNNPKKIALANAPEQVLAMAIRDAMLKDKEKGK